MQKEKSSVPSVERTIAIMEYLGNQPSRVSLKDLSAALGFPNASVFRIIKYLVGAGYISEHVGTINTYSLGLKVLQLAQKAVNQIDLSEVSREIMRTLAEKSAQTCQLAVLSNEKVMYVDQFFPSSYAVSIIAPLHTPLSANLSATGKVLYACADDNEQKRLLKLTKFESKTEKSIANIRDFKKCLKEVAAQGFATDIEEFAVGIGCIGAPIFDHTGRVIAAIGLTGHIANYNDSVEFEKLKKLTIEAGLGISRKLGYGIE